MPQDRPADLHDRAARVPRRVPRHALPWLCLAAGGGWLGYRAWQTYAARRRHHRPHPVTVRPDGVGVDPLDAPARAAPRPVTTDSVTMDSATDEHPTTGPMTTHEVEENAWNTAGPHVGSVEGRHRALN